MSTASNKLIRCIFLGLLFVGHPFGQTRTRGFEIPPDLGAVFMLDQKDSPVVFEKIQLFTDRKGSFPEVRYVIRNTLNKAIASISVEFHQKSKIPNWQSHSGYWVESTGDETKMIPVIPAYGTYENFPYNSKRDQTFPENMFKTPTENSSSKLVTVWFGLVARVTFVDGTEYRAPKFEEGFNALLIDY